MKRSQSVIWGLIGLWVAGILQFSLAPRLAIGLGWPDFGLALLGSLGLYYDRRGATVLGFGAGWVHGCLAGVNLTVYVISRTLCGFLLGWLVGAGIKRSVSIAVVAGIGVSVLAQFVVLFFGAHRGPLLPYLAGTLMTSMYDGVIAALLFVFVNRIVGPRQQDRY